MNGKLFRGVLAAGALLTAVSVTDILAGEKPPGTVAIREWEVPYPQSRPRDPFVVSSDEVWFVGQTGDYAARFTPSTGEFTRFALPEGSGPHNIVVGGDGIPFYAGNRGAHIGRLDPATGRVDHIPVNNKGYSDPHTLVFDEKGDIWFTLQSGNAVGRLSKDDLQVSLIQMPTPSARPYGIKIDEEGTIWIAEFGTNKLGVVDPAALTVREIPLPRESARPRRLAVTSDGRIWYVDYRGGYLGRYDPKRRTFREWQLPGGTSSRPYGMAADDRDVVWLVETGSVPNRLVGFDTGAERFTSVTDIPSGGGSVRHMHYHAGSGTVWFGTDRNTIGYARVHDAGSDRE
jgi:virginiamycin B lyase